jgi:hypothetical protein
VIHSIFNGRSLYYYYNKFPREAERTNYHNVYFYLYNKIKNGLEPGCHYPGHFLKLRWLYAKEIRREIRAWRGDPFALLY